MFPVEQDGVYGDSTRRSVMAFQQHVGLPATGAVDSASLDRSLPCL